MMTPSIISALGTNHPAMPVDARIGHHKSRIAPRRRQIQVGQAQQARGILQTPPDVPNCPLSLKRCSADRQQVSK